MFKEHLLILNVLDNIVNQIPTNITQNDSNTNKINVTLVAGNNKLFDFTSSTKATVTIIKANGNLVSITEGNNLKIVDKANGKLEILLPVESVTVPGICQGTVDLFEGDNRLTSSRFSYNVVRDIYNDYQGVEVEESTLYSLIKATETVSANANQAATNANTAASNANQAATNISTTLATKLDKTDVVNTTTQVETDKKALNAAQANPSIPGTLAQQINVLTSYVVKASGDVATFTLGKYTCSSSCINLPTNAWYRIVVDVDTNGNKKFTAWSEASKVTYQGYKATSESTITWQQNATVTQIQAMIDASLL